jgi:cell division protein FtsW
VRSRRDMPLEYSLLLTATLCLLAFGAVMVFSASSSTQLLGGTGDGAYYFKRTVVVALAGLLLMRMLSLRGTKIVRNLTPAFLAISGVLLLAVLIPGVGTTTNGASRWIGSGSFFQVQPSELAKLALVLYSVKMLAEQPRLVRDIESMLPVLGMVAAGGLLILVEPDLGTAMVLALATCAILVAAGAKLRQIALIVGVGGLLVLMVALAQPYMRERLFGFLNPGADAAGAGFQAAQAKIALGSGGLFGVGLGQGVQKAFYLPEAHTDMIAAVVGEELGLFGISALVALYSLFGYAGFSAAKRARGRYEKLLAAGLTSLVLGQAAINLFAVMGMAPITGVPLPFVSYGNSSLLVMLASAGLILNVARRRPGRRAAERFTPPFETGDAPAKLRVIKGGKAKRSPARTSRKRVSSGANSRASGGDRSRRNSGARGAGAGRRRRAAG